MQVKDVMTPNPITIDPEAPLATAMAVMKKGGIRHLLVTDDHGRLVGIITDRDVRSAAFTPALIEHLSGRAERRVQGLGQVLEELRVRDAMTWDIVTTHPEISSGTQHAYCSSGASGAFRSWMARSWLASSPSETC
jgi:acetoin utilization protein AcuB